MASSIACFDQIEISGVSLKAILISYKKFGQLLISKVATCSP